MLEHPFDDPGEDPFALLVIEKLLDQSAGRPFVWKLNNRDAASLCAFITCQAHVKLFVPVLLPSRHDVTGATSSAS